jgi:hypothetical protein
MRPAHGDVPPIHDALVARLTRAARPVRRLWPPAVRLSAWLLLAMVVVVTAARIGMRQDLPDQLRRPLYLLEVAVLLAVGGAAAIGALRAAVPGLAGPRARYVALGLAVSTSLIVVSELASATSWLPGSIETGLRCASCVGLFGFLPWVALLVAVGRGAPLDGRVAGAYAGGAAVFVGAAAVRVACPIDDPLHLLSGHMLPVVLWSALSAIAGVAWLTRWRRRDAAAVL